MPFAEKYLHLAVEKFNSETAAIYLARLYFYKNKLDKIFSDKEEGFLLRMGAWPIIATCIAKCQVYLLRTYKA